MIKYLLSTGQSTTKIEQYILDLLKLNMKIYPNDIPGIDVGFNFILGDVKKDELISTIESRIGSLVSKIQNRFEKEVYKINIKSIDLIDRTRARVIISVGDYSDSISFNIV